MEENAGFGHGVQQMPVDQDRNQTSSVRKLGTSKALLWSQVAVRALAALNKVPMGSPSPQLPPLSQI